MTNLAETPFACPPRESGQENTFEGARLFQLNYAMHAEAFNLAMMGCSNAL